MTTYILIALILWCTACSSIFAKNTQSHEFKLDNGLKIVIHEDHRAPVVVSQLWYKVGGSYEHGGITGISHALEHMMFKGSKHYPMGQQSRLIAEKGGQQNAFTTSDYTCYYQQIDCNQLDLCFKLEADRMRNLHFDKEEFLKEMNVIMEERRLRYEDNPEALTRERFFAQAYISSPYHNPTIGWMDDIKNFTIDDLKTWYNQWYHPNNAILVVVGNVNPKDVLDKARIYFGPLKFQELPKQKPRKEVLSLGEKQITVNLPAKVPYLILGYHTPNILEAKEGYEPYALTVLLMMLDGGNSSRFSEILLRNQGIASSILSNYSPFELHSSLFMISAIPAKDKSLEQLESAILSEISRVQTELISDEELNRIKTIIIADHFYKQDSMMEKASSFGRLEAIGLPWYLDDQYIHNIQSVTKQQIQTVAKKYLIKDRLTKAILKPTAIGAYPE